MQMELRAIARRAGAALAVLLCLCPLRATAQISDTTSPQIAGVTITPTAINTTTSPANVTVNLHITDDLSGFNYGYYYFRKPSGNLVSAFIGSRISGTATDGVYQAVLTVPAYSEPGTWIPGQCVVYDVTGNSRLYDGTELTGLGASDVTVTSVLDNTGPTVTGASFLTTIDTTSGPVTLTVTVNATDDLSGLNFGYYYFRAPSGTQVSAGLSRISSTQLRGTITFPQFSQPGTWASAHCVLYDVAGNSNNTSEEDLAAAGAPSLTVISVQDVNPPSLISFDYSPKAIDVAQSSKNVTVTVHASDDLSGAYRGYVYFYSPSSAQNVIPALFYASGSASNVTLTTTATFPQFSETGLWKVNGIVVFDHTEKVLQLSTSDLIAAGFPTVLQVSSGLTTDSVTAAANSTITLYGYLNNAGSPVANETISFSLLGTPVGSAVTNASGVATLPNVSLAGISQGTYANEIVASFAGNALLAATTGKATLTVTEPPVISSISPVSVVVGSTGNVITVTGHLFEPGGVSTVRMDGVDVATTYIDSDHLQATVPNSYCVVAHAFTVAVYNTGPNGGLSNAATYSVTNPAPAITLLSTTSIPIGRMGLSLTITGTGFLAGATVTVDASPSGPVDILIPASLTSTSILVGVPGNDIAAVGTVKVTVSNPAPTAGPSNILTFTLTPLPPNVTGSVSITNVSGPTYNAISGLWTVVKKITNTSGAVITGPIQLVYSSLTPGTTMTNASGIVFDTPFKTALAGNLAAGASVNVTGTFTWPGPGVFTFTNSVYKGTF
jgi:hypothetical protein